MERQAWMTSKCSLTAMLSLACCLSKLLIMRRLSEFLTRSKHAPFPLPQPALSWPRLPPSYVNASGQTLARTLLDEVIAQSGFPVIFIDESLYNEAVAIFH